MAGLIAMMSVLVVVSIEMFFASRGAGHMHTSDHHEILQGTDVVLEAGPGGHTQTSRGIDTAPGLNGPVGDDDDYDGVPDQRGFKFTRVSKKPSRLIANNGERVYHDVEEGGDVEVESDEMESDPDSDPPGPKRIRREETEGFIHHPTHQYHRPRSATNPPRNVVPDHSGDFLSEEQQEKKLLLQCLLLEAGILFHSVFIGMALSVATGTSFIVLLVAISFHRETLSPCLIKLYMQARLIEVTFFLGAESDPIEK